MDRFKELLEEEGSSNQIVRLGNNYNPNTKFDIAASDLKLIQVKESESFKRKEIVYLKLDNSVFINKQVDVDWYPKIDSLESATEQVLETLNKCAIWRAHTIVYLDKSIFRNSEF